VADANGPYAAGVGETVTFDATGSVDPDGTIVAYEWEFGDGNFGTGPTPTHSYSVEGTYNVTLHVTDADGATDSAGTTANITSLTEPEVPAPEPELPDPEEDMDSDDESREENDHDSDDESRDDDDHDSDDESEDEHDDDRDDSAEYLRDRDRD
jgi:PKD repeat protein